MSEKNQDVVRALAAFGSDQLPYHSFGPFVVRPRISHATPDAAILAAERRAGVMPSREDPYYYTDQLDEPSVAPLPMMAPPPLPPANPQPTSHAAPRLEPMPPRGAPQLRERVPQPQAHQLGQTPSPYAPNPYAPGFYPSPAAPQPMSAPEPVAMPSAPLYPLLAASLPEAAEPMGAILPQSPAPMPMPAGPSRVGVPSSRAPEPSATNYGTFTSAAAKLPLRPGELPSLGLAAAMGTPGPAGAGDPDTDRRSLTDMFRLLSGHAEQPPPPPTPEPPPIADHQALFRRI